MESLTRWNLFNAVAELVHSHVAALAEDNDIGIHRSAVCANCAQRLYFALS